MIILHSEVKKLFSRYTTNKWRQKEGIFFNKNWFQSEGNYPIHFNQTTAHLSKHQITNQFRKNSPLRFRTKN